MDKIRLKSLREGSRAAVTKVLNKLEDAIVDMPFDPADISALLEAVEKKKKTLGNIDEQILNTADSDGITDEKSSQMSIIEKHERRIAIIKEKKLCINCYGTHKVSYCRSKYDCRNRHCKHHTLLCKENTTTSQSENKDKTKTSMLYISASRKTSTVLLKAAVPQEMSVNNTAEINIIFDEGDQQSFIITD
ncbi:Hypothetical predicted protein [Mytilus galloprovincialis]|uniref:Uncharacterized protein n=1 Tax=Mytilus galloprovincialis TaxID=29158 RepID=A0A8B6FAP2_MYTGA|nr:Hypothetical predicted protein [Mytilus galloprovincialis]